LLESGTGGYTGGLRAWFHDFGKFEGTGALFRLLINGWPGCDILTAMTPSHRGREFVLERYALRMVLRGLGVLVLLAAVAYPADWALWRVRVARGGGMGQVEVSLFTVAELKGGKEDYYPNGTIVLGCSESLYPQGGVNPCWWQRRHRELIQRY